jgi:UDP-N-acetylmuramoyl-tripeptide--D-alanyl-D-alanine ligase
MIFPILIITLGWAINIFFRMKYSLHMMQIEMYDNPKYMNWVNKNKDKIYTKKTKVFVIATVLMSYVYLCYGFNSYLFAVLWAGAAVFSIEFAKYDLKKPLVMTKRAKRLMEGTLLLIVLDGLIVYGFSRWIAGNEYYISIYAFILSLSVYYGLYYIVGGIWLLSPVEKSINHKFYRMAQEKIKSYQDLKTIGITGSYGKTSTKFIVATITNQRYKTYHTPESYNTPMGISKAINEELDETYCVFVAELGAERMGEIKEVAQLVNPKIGVLTSIGPCHLETFKTIENIMKTKYELIEELPPDGIAIFNYDNEHVKKLADMTYTKKILYGLEKPNDLDVFADQIVTTPEGSTFTLHIKEKGNVVCKTKLLGRHNILNILAGAAVGYALDMTLVQISSGIEKIEPVAHRLELINPGTGVTVIDDAFNSNPDGAAAALDVLSQFNDQRKIIVTPGMIELGPIEYEENKKFGKKIASVCDYAILVGVKRTEAIQEGLVESGFDKERIILVKSLKDSQEILKNLLKPNDVVLFENDLPETYNEE